MKNLLYFPFLILLFLLSCEDETADGKFDFGEDEIFHTDQYYRSGDNSLKISIREINDSRCPADVVCIWQGETVVKIEIESPQKSTVSLKLYEDPIDTIGNYSFELKDVSPYPVSTETTLFRDYDVTLRIEKIGF